jgi:hypothetical protein
MVIFRQHLSRVRNLTPLTDYSLVARLAVQDRYENGSSNDTDRGKLYYVTEKANRSFCLEIRVMKFSG